MTTITTATKQISSPQAEEMIMSFLGTHPEGALTTMSTSGALQSSVINTVARDNYQLVFMTRRSTTKFKNLQQNPTVAYICFDIFSRTEVAIEGVATLITSEDEALAALRLIEGDAKNGSHHISPFVDEKNEFVLYTLYPRSVHMTTYWKREEKMEAYHESVEFDLQIKD